MWIFWLVLIGCGFYFWGYGPRYYRRPRMYRYEESPFEIARARLARGEINPEEFQKRLTLLDQNQSYIG